MKSFQTVELEDIATPPKYIVKKDVTYQTRIKGRKLRLMSLITGKDSGQLEEDGTLTIFAGYPYDGPSAFGIDTKNFMDGSLAHDWFYDAFRQARLPQKLRNLADLTMQDINLAHGMGRMRAWWTYRGVRRGGASSAEVVRPAVVVRAE